jgi:2,3-bisphosphoglycerate-dependent phosphoglycerate mutase
MPTLILLRHGQSTYNAEGRFTGTTDVPLTDLGRRQAREAASLLAGFSLAAAFTSERIRARETLDIVLQELGLHLPVSTAHELNEQDFGDLEGVNKELAEQYYSPEKVLEWRRAFHAHPPKGERFIAVQTRVAACYRQSIAPVLAGGQDVLVVAHGNSLRALAIYLMNIDLPEIVNFELENAQPFCIETDVQGNPRKSYRLL